MKKEDTEFAMLASVVMGILAVSGWGIYEHYFNRGLSNCPPRSKYSRITSDMRSLATALESYKIDNGVYPAWSSDPNLNAYAGLTRTTHTNRQPTFLLGSAQHPNLKTLTTPIAYISCHFADPFSFINGAPFSYWSRTEILANGEEMCGWLLWSPGPDLVYQITVDNVDSVYDPRDQAAKPALIELTYDPTNGARSAGDVWRMKQ